jgi:hypothetical protein
MEAPVMVQPADALLAFMRGIVIAHQVDRAFRDPQLRSIEFGVDRSLPALGHPRQKGVLREMLQGQQCPYLLFL